MKNLYIESTQHSPRINFSFTQNTLEIVGSSYPENTAEFYFPVLLWLENYLKSVSDRIITFNIELFYLNTSSIKILMDIFDMLEQISQKNKLIINWFYDAENSTSFEIGKMLKEGIELPTINMVEKTKL